MSATTIYNSYSIALPSVQVAAAAGQGLLSRAVEAAARCLTRSIVERPVAQSARTVPAQWRTDAALRQHGMRDWLETQTPDRSAVQPAPRGTLSAAQTHKALWLELVG